MTLRSLASALLCLLALLGSAAAEPALVGPSFPINTKPFDYFGRYAYKDLAQIAKLKSGRFVVVWAVDERLGGGGQTISRAYGRILRRDGSPAGEQFLVFRSGSDQFSPNVASLGDGGFVVAWNSPTGMFIHRFDDSGDAIGSRARIHTAEDHDPVQIASLSGGGFVVAWNSDGRIMSRIFDRDGSPAGKPIELADDGRCPVLVAGSEGRFVTGYVSGSKLRLLEASETGSTVRAVVTAARPFRCAQLARLNNGGLVATWKTKETDGFVQLFDRALSPVTSMRVYNYPEPPEDMRYPYNRATVPAIASTRDGGFLLMWRLTTINDHYGNGVHSAPYLRSFSAKGKPLGKVVQLGPTDTMTEGDALIPMRDGNILGVWSGAPGMMGQIYAP
jgi:hypothetical protein